MYGSPTLFVPSPTCHISISAGVGKTSKILTENRCANTPLCLTIIGKKSYGKVVQLPRCVWLHLAAGLWRSVLSTTALCHHCVSLLAPSRWILPKFMKFWWGWTPLSRGKGQAWVRQEVKNAECTNPTSHDTQFLLLLCNFPMPSHI